MPRKRPVALPTFLIVNIAFSVISPPVLAAANPAGLPSLLCEFNEGKVIATISTEGLVLAEYSGKPKSYAYLSGNVADPKAQAYTFQTNDTKTKVLINIRRETGTDGVTELEYQLAADFPGGSGACTEFPQGFVPRHVRGVATNDVLNIRSKATEKSSIVATADVGGWVFVSKSTTSTKGSKTKWAKVAVPVVPANESGPIKTVVGFVNNSFVTQVPDAVR
jgi:hypothetical protein